MLRDAHERDEPPKERRMRVVTGEQYREGYLVLNGRIATRRSYQAVRRLTSHPDVTYLVYEPEIEPGAECLDVLDVRDERDPRAR